MERGGSHRITLRSLTFLVASALSSSSSATTIGVVSVGEDTDALAAEVRSGLPAALPTGDTVLEDGVLRERLSPPPGPTVTALGAEAMLEGADTAFNAVEHEKSVSLLETVIEQLEADTTFSIPKRDLLQKARLLCARRLLGLAGPGETGKAETKNGERARLHLEAALRAEPNLVLDPASTPPKLQTLLSVAADAVKRSGRGAMAIKSTPNGANVILEGRNVGQTPLVTAATVAAGRYRVWVEKDGRQSLPRVVDVGDTMLSAEINLVVESALRPAGPGLSAPLVPLSADDVSRLAVRLGVDRLVVVSADGSDRVVGVFASDGRLISSSRSETLVATDVITMATTTSSPSSSSSTTSSQLPVSLYAPNTETFAAAASDDGGFPWVGVAVGVGAVVAAGAITGAVLLLTTTQEGTISVAVVKAP